MAATTSGALKAYIEGLGLGLSVYRDAAPGKDSPEKERLPAVPFPFVTVRESISTVLNMDGDLSDAAATVSARELVQVDLWQRWRDLASLKPLESYTLPGALVKRLRGARLVPVGTAVVYGVAGVSFVRLLEEERNVVHHAITCTVHRAV